MSMLILELDYYIDVNSLPRVGRAGPRGNKRNILGCPISKGVINTNKLIAKICPLSSRVRTATSDFLRNTINCLRVLTQLVPKVPK
jgi:hypothetical protein